MCKTIDGDSNENIKFFCGELVSTSQHCGCLLDVVYLIANYLRENHLCVCYSKAAMLLT